MQGYKPNNIKQGRDYLSKDHLSGDHLGGDYLVGDHVGYLY